jgi:hypothetical protein
MTPLESMRLHVGATDPAQDAILNMYMDDAQEFILAFTRRRTVPQALRHLWIRVAVVLYNRRGMEGSQKYNVGDTAYMADVMPQDIIRQLNSYRAARVINMFTAQEE